ncbi:hypothetical protein CEP53_005987 [Fusarium sp. AF-6]|nr:hypothetical protein CEP53_005987 [Fusarium sp. AF-6]
MSLKRLTLNSVDLYLGSINFSSSIPDILPVTLSTSSVDATRRDCQLGLIVSNCFSLSRGTYHVVDPAYIWIRNV